MTSKIIIKIDGKDDNERLGLMVSLQQYLLTLDYITNELANYYRTDGSKLFKHEPETCAMIRKYQNEQDH